MSFYQLPNDLRDEDFFLFILFGLFYLAPPKLWVALLNIDSWPFLLFEFFIIDALFFALLYQYLRLYSTVWYLNAGLFWISGIIGGVILEFCIRQLPGITFSIPILITFFIWAQAAVFASMQTDREAAITLVRWITLFLYVLFSFIATIILITMQIKGKGDVALTTIIIAAVGYYTIFTFFWVYMRGKLGKNPLTAEDWKELKNRRFRRK